MSNSSPEAAALSRPAADELSGLPGGLADVQAAPPDVRYNTGLHVSENGATLNAVPETRPLARRLRRRSAGIRDLRHGRFPVEAEYGVKLRGALLNHPAVYEHLRTWLA